MKKIIITIDGPAASGKGKIAKYISRKWKYKHLDSGVLYRRLAYILSKKKINIESKNEVKNAISKQKTITFRNYKKFRNENISKIASKIAVYNFVREYINKIQRNRVSLLQLNRILRSGYSRFL